jgi:hypothetical protein
MWIKFSISSPKHKIFLKQSKCAFGESLKLSTLGHIVGKDGVRVDPKKIEAMQNWPRPKTLKIMQWFPRFNRLLSQVCSKLWKNHDSSNNSP